MKYLTVTSLFVLVFQGGFVLSQKCSELARRGDCAFYEICVEGRRECGPNEYALGYGSPFCKAFKEHEKSFTTNGRTWSGKVRTCLMGTLLNSMHGVNVTCPQIREFAFDSHPACYVNHGFCTDILPNICNMITMTVVFKEHFGAIRRALVPTVTQIKDTLAKCASKTFDFVTTKLKEYSGIATEVYNAVTNINVKNLAHGIVNAGRNYAKRLYNNILGVFDAVISFNVEELYRNTIERIGAVVNSVKEFYNKAMEMLKALMNKLIAIYDIRQAIMDSVIFNVKETLRFIKDLFEELLACLLPNCQTDVDVIFVIDSSGSIGASNYATMKNFVADAIVALNLTNNSRIGVITFESYPTTRIRLAPVRNVRRLAATVRNIYYTTGGTATDRALRAMLAAFGRGDPDRLRIGILLTDGQSNSPLATMQAASVVHSSGIVMYTIGIGSANLAELKAIATHPPNEYSFQISSFAASRFNQLLLPLVSQTCTTPREKVLGDTYVSHLGKGDSNYIKTPFDEKGVTLEFNVKEGGIDVYGSFLVRNPGKATADFSFPVRGEVSYFVSTEYFERVTGIQLDRRYRRQAINQGIRNHTIHLTITGVSENNNFSAVTVADNKVPPAKDIFVRIQRTEYTVGEDDEFVHVYFEAVREVSPGSDIYVVANYTFDFELLVKTVNGSATINADFQPLVASVNFSAGGQFSTPFIIKINDDIISEGPEHFKVMYNISTDSVPSGATVRQLDVEATVEIVDNDAKIISFQESFQTVAESAGVVELRLVADNVFEREQFIDLSAVDGTANNDSCIFETDGTSDYNLTSDRVRFPPNSTLSDPFQVQIVDDLKVENQESFSLSFVIPEAASNAGAIYGQNRTLDVLIQDDDGVRIGFEEDSAIGLEGSTVSLKIYKQGCIGRGVKVSMGAEHITASAIDYDIKRFIKFRNVTSCTERKTLKIKLKKDMDQNDTAIETFTVVMERVNRRRVGFDQRCVNVNIVDPALSTVSSPP